MLWGWRRRLIVPFCFVVLGRTVLRFQLSKTALHPLNIVV
jgi:hypothetical protein